MCVWICSKFDEIIMCHRNFYKSCTLELQEFHNSYIVLSKHTDNIEQNYQLSRHSKNMEGNN